MALVGNTYLVRGDESSLPELYKLLELEGVQVLGNPDVYTRVYAHFGIDEARELSARAFGKSIASKRRVFIAAIGAITHEAQNALLKTLEEPPADSQFFLLVASPEMLLPTLRSRAQMLSLQNVSASVSTVDVRSFLKAKPRERIEMLKPLLEKNDDDTRDIAGVITFLSSVERMLDAGSRERFDEAHRKELEAARRAGIEAVYRARKYAGDKGSLLKPLLEQVALLVPVL
jgi:DNA polymerase III delta prime subunit